MSHDISLHQVEEKKFVKTYNSSHCYLSHAHPIGPVQILDEVHLRKFQKLASGRQMVILKRTLQKKI